MKKYIKALPIIFYPYIYMIYFLGYFLVASNSSGQNKTSEIFLIVLLVLAVVCNLYSFITSFSFIHSAKKGKYSAKQLTKLNMIIKTVQIPAYIIHFCLGLLGLIMSVWGIPIILWAIFIDFITIVLSGVVGISANIGAKKENILSSGQAVLFSILGFVYCVDVFISILLYIRVKRKIIKNQLNPDLQIEK